MIEMHNVTDYGRDSYNREADTGKDSAGVDFGDIMAGSEETSDNHGIESYGFERRTDFLGESAVEVAIYNQGGRIQMIGTDSGVNLDITV